jgi:hypothetical protein
LYAIKINLMAFSSYLNMGISYNDAKNYFNALVSFETTFSKDFQLTAGVSTPFSRQV